MRGRRSAAGTTQHTTRLPSVASFDSEEDGWLKLWQIRATSGLAGIWTVIGVGLFLGAGLGAASIVATLHPGWRSWNPILAGFSLLAAIPVTFLAHEATHGLAFKAFGGSPSFGAGTAGGMPYFYAACPGWRLVRDHFLVVGLAPLIVLDTVALLLMLPEATASFGAGLLAFNTSGAVGDLWAVMVMLQAPRWIEVEDTGPIFIMWAPPERAREAAGLRRPWGLDLPAGRWLAPWYVTTLVLTVLGAGVLGALTRSAGSKVWLGPLFLASRHELNLVGGLLVAAVASAGITALMALISRRLRRRR